MKQVNTQVMRVALITGAARRIGAAIATHLHEANFRVVIHCHRSTEEAMCLAERLNQQRPDSARVLTADLRQKKEIAALMTATLKWSNRLDLLVNNAALFKRLDDPMDEITWDALFTTNVQAPFWLSHAAYPALAATRGSIINITDTHTEKPLKGYSAYCQSKAALMMQTKALAREFAPEVRVNAIAPGAIAWPEHDNALNQDLQQRIIEKTLLKQHGNPLYIAKAVLSLVDNPFITGQSLSVDGGR